MKRALYRSVWFWLGCFVLAFLVWAWVDSRKTQTHAFASRWVGEDTGGGGFNASIGLVDGVLVNSGNLFIHWSRVTITDPKCEVRPIVKRLLREPAASDGKWFSMPWVSSEGCGNVRGATVVLYRVKVPMWGIVGLWLLLCGGVLVWWRRRWRRVLLEAERECVK